jgi:hypothetical protein
MGATPRGTITAGVALPSARFTLPA